MNNKYKPRTSIDDEEDDEDVVGAGSVLGYFVKQEVANQYTVTIDEPFVSPKYYRGIISMLMGCTENDSVIFLINSPGGALNGLLTLLEGINMTDATTIAVLVGECASAASMFALHCDQVHVSDNATMLCHNVRYGTGGKGADVLSHVQHVSQTSEKLLRKTYTHFLKEQEIDEMIGGREIYLNAEDIRERLQNKQDILDALDEELPEIVEPTSTKHYEQG